MVALNQFASAEKFIAEQLALNPALGAVPRVHLARALARAALGDLTGAVEESELAQNLLAQDAELGSEVNVAWWLFKKKLPETEEEINDAKLQESLEAIEPEVKRLSEKPTYGTLRWPRVVLGWLGESARVGRS